MKGAGAQVQKTKEKKKGKDQKVTLGEGEQLYPFSGGGQKKRGVDQYVRQIRVRQH